MQNLMYLRKSRQDDPNDSVEEVLARHRRTLEELADRQGLLVTQIYEEVVSGDSLYARPQMLRLLDRVREGDVGAILCMDIDRLGRGGMSDQGVILDSLRLSGTLIVTPDKTYDLNDDNDVEMTEFKAFFARAEYRMIRKRMKRGSDAAREAGAFVATAPYGYRNVRVGKMPTLEIVEEEAAFIRHIYERYLQGVGAHTIAHELNAMGSVPHRGAEWNRNTVRYILRNPTFAGKLALGRVKHQRPKAPGEKHHVTYTPEDQWRIIDGLHPAIIPWETWQQVQVIRRNNYIPPNYTGRCANPFAGLIYCGVCGKHVQRMGDNQGDPRILCTHKGCCGSTKFALVEDAVLSALHDQLDALKLDIAANAPADTALLEASLESVAKELAKLEARVPRLYAFLEDGLYDRPTFLTRLEAAEKEKAALLTKQDDIKAQIDHARRRDAARMVSELSSALELYPTLDAGGRNALLKPLVDHIVYNKPKRSKPNDFTLQIHLRDFYLP